VLGIHQIDFQAVLFENLKDWHPRNTGRLPDYPAHAFCHQPAAHLLQIGGKTSETPHWLGVAIRADGHSMLACAHIHPRPHPGVRFPGPSSPLSAEQICSVLEKVWSKPLGLPNDLSP
jgi:hypothetical protein